MRRFCSKHLEQALAATVRHPVGFSQHSPIFLLHLDRATSRRSKTNVSTDRLRCYTNIINQKQRTRARGNPTVADIRGRKHRLQLAHSQRSVWKNKMCTTKQSKKNTLTAIFSRQSCNYLTQILRLAPTAEFCANPTDDSTTFGIL